MEVAGRGQRLQMQEKLRILEDLNMLYIRQIAISLQDTEIQRKMERELRLREGACKLLAACSRREQALEAAKSLLVCNSRVLAYMAELQRRKEAQVLRRTTRRPSDAGPTDERLPCRGTVCISDLRIPLMWKDTEYFRNKGELHRCAVFCLLQLGAEIHDTPMVLVDRTLTDICFESAVLFSEAGPDFELKVELYSAGLAGGPPGNGGTSPLLLPAPNVPGPKFHLLAHAVLSLAEVQDGFRTHDLAITSNVGEESSFWLPLYGSMCCRLAAQPRCMAAPVTSGFLRLQQPGAEAQSGTRLYCVLRGTDLLCYHDPSEAEAGLEPALTIAVNKETRIRAAEREGRGQPHGMAVTNRYGGEEVTHTLLAESRAEAQRWMEAFWQHFYDMSEHGRGQHGRIPIPGPCRSRTSSHWDPHPSGTPSQKDLIPAGPCQWKQCCDELMRIEAPPPRRPAAMLPRQGSLYHEMALPGPAVPPSACEGLLLQDNAVSEEIRALLSSYYSDR
ncbi:rhotekin isoform x2 [Limosa lapponica baueri]|uniref:Rhotekin isoform x2 n=1 Tax=Limosa lapponica baueri TaxID=1758121 RepID=A0A2I0UL60_LIMLA|nr:rhotekin isoform x2 [Limosa lapponica baueri]